MSQPKQVAELLRSILAEVGSKVKRTKFVRVLREVLGAELADHCQVMGFRAGRLTVEVDSAPLYAELTGFRSEEIRVECNRRLAADKIAQIVFRMGGTGHV